MNNTPLVGKWSAAERRLVYFGLEAIPGGRDSASEGDGARETKEKRDERIDATHPKEHADRVKQRVREDDARTQQERAESDIRLGVAMAMQGLDVSDADFGNRLRAALDSVDMASVAIKAIGARGPEGVPVRLESERMGYRVTFIATDAGTAEKVEVALEPGGLAATLEDQGAPEAEAPQDRDGQQEVLRRQWLKDVLVELGIDAADVTLGTPIEVSRTPAEQYGLYVKDRGVAGHLVAGTRDGRQDPEKYDYSRLPVVTFRETGFKDQVKRLERQIKVRLSR